MTTHYKTDEEARAIVEELSLTIDIYPEKEKRPEILERSIGEIDSLRSSDKEALLGVIEGWIEKKAVWKADPNHGAEDWIKVTDLLAQLAFLQGLRK